ncbi:DedA family protein [Stenotrophobium rhamnosiphilum]|uniref:DedA family protein n=1 Tax=Stenotrophobium rhamnosiphilum TaxID=2029166 RepID=UPI0019D2DA6C|nr:DedA family protein [Stenotrophobium rhamnosiphilum]
MSFLQPLIDWYLAQLATGGYPLIVLLMAIESSFLPLPSELVIPPAAILASRGGELTYVGIVIAGTVGSWIGATFMYWGSRWLGRPLAMRYGRYFMISPEKIEAAERWAAQYGAAGVFISRLLPVIRHLVGIPFGIVKMNFLRYSIFTILGSAIWCTVLTVIGVHAGQDEALMRGDLHQITLWIIVGAAILGALYYFLVHRAMKKT